MPRHHAVLAASYNLLKAARAIGRPLGIASKNSLRVLTYHDISPSEEPGFAAQLRWLARTWKFVPAIQFERFIRCEEPIVGRNLFLTFDDGFASNRGVAERVLRPMGISAMFFIVSDFVSISDRGEAREFISRNIYPGMPLAEIPAHWHNMGWTDLEYLLEHEHTIGCHTRTHAKLSKIKTKTGLESEIVNSANLLSKRLGIAINHFAYTFGNLESFSPMALSVARDRFRFVYSGLRGNNARYVSPFAVRREAISASDPLPLVGAYVEGLADFRYYRSGAELASWL